MAANWGWEVESPVLLTIEKGLLICADGDKAGEWLKMFGDSKAARNVAEFGIGTTKCNIDREYT